MATAIGVISGFMTIFSFMDTYFPSPSSGETKINIAVAVDGEAGTSNGGGDLPDVRLWDIYGDFLGMKADPGKVRDGEVGEITVRHSDGNKKQAPYTLFSANDDAICIAYASITFASGEKYWWDGTFGQTCGHTWYYSGVYLQESNYRPNCTWIDKNGDQPQTGFQVRWPTFADESLSDTSAASVCDTIDYKVYFDEDPRGIVYDPNPNDKRSLAADQGKRSAAEPPAPAPAPRRRNTGRAAGERRARALRQRQAFASQLVIDDSPENQAWGLCGSDSSLGPDFVNTAEGVFCRMSDKTVHPVCAPGAPSGGVDCFDMQTLTLGGGAGGGGGYNVTARATTSYKVTTDWRHGGNVKRYL